MLVLSREPGMSIHVSSTDQTCLVTVLKLLPEKHAAMVLINRATIEKPGQLECRTAEVTVDVALPINEDMTITLVDLREHVARLGINAPKDHAVHRLEVYQAIKRDNESGPEDGLAGTRVPRPPSPKPPSLEVSLEEPDSEI